jgi:1-acyl-sn-glycerol-3-phosphate acyltransferase
VDYLRKGFSSKFKAKVAFMAARTYLNSILRKKQMIVKDLVGIENFDGLTGGAVLTCNHFNALDSFAIQLAYENSKHKHSGKKFYRIIREGNYTSFPGFYGFLMRNCNTLPLSSNINTMKEFSKATDKLLQEGNFILIYPEQSMWWNYRKPKPLKKGGFTFAARNNVPVLPCFITMKDSEIIGDDGFPVQEYTIHICAPIYPDPAKSRSVNVNEMMQKNYDVWKDLYEKTYGIPLEYDTE